MASSSHSSSRYDVFLSFRGEDVRKTYVDHLHSAFLQQGIHAFKDDQTLPRGESIGPSLLKAIEESKISVIIFSEKYADSSWCLDELVHIMKCRAEKGQIVYPVFYDVNPSDVRKQRLKLENGAKAESWRKALFDASNIAGWEPSKMANGHESIGIKEIVNIISDKLFSLMSHADEDLVGMGTRLYSLKSMLEIGSSDVRMVGIWGMGGSGKTTLASSLYAEISQQFDAHCIIDNVREESSTCGLKSLQEKVLSQVLKTKVEVNSVDDGKRKIKSRLCDIKVLILLDDVDNVEQLEALAGSHKWFGDGSRVMITTRDEHLLTTHKVDIVSHTSLLSLDEASRLFKKHAYDKERPVEDYKTLSSRVVTYAAGLPLALKVLGSFLYGKNKNEWMSTLARLEVIPHYEVVEKLKISFDGLGLMEKEIFLDIACFHRGRSRNDAMQMLHASGFHPVIGIKELKQKALITIRNGCFDMHDLLQEMGHYIVRGEHPNNPEKHSRVWKTKEINELCLRDPTTANDKIEVLKYYQNTELFDSSTLTELVSSMKKLRLLEVKLWSSYKLSKKPIFLSSDELRYIDVTAKISVEFPKNLHPTKLVVLKLKYGLQKQVWMGYKLVPRLLELDLSGMKKLLRTPDFDGFPCLEKLKLHSCSSLEEIHPSLGNHKSLVHIKVSYCDRLRKFPAITCMEKLETLRIHRCKAICEFPEIKGNMDSLELLELVGVGIQVLPSSIGEYCTNLIWLKVRSFKRLKSVQGNFHALKKYDISFQTGWSLPKNVLHLTYQRLLTRMCLMSRFKKGQFVSDILALSNLQELNLWGNDFSRLDFSLSQLTHLKVLILSCCKYLIELPELPSSITTLDAEYCKSLEIFGDSLTKNCKRLSKVLLTNVRCVVGADKLLQTMLEGVPRCLFLRLDGLEIPKLFKAPPEVGWSSNNKLQLPENWYSDFSGFLICSTFNSLLDSVPEVYITMEHERSLSRIHDFESEVLLEENAKSTWVGYVPFALLRNTAWWNQTSTLISFNIRPSDFEFGVTLVHKRNLIERTQSHDYDKIFKIQHDSKDSLSISLKEILKTDERDCPFVLRLNPYFT